MQTANIPDAIRYHVEEIKLRGTYVNMAVDVDFILIAIISSVFQNDDNKIKSVPLSSNHGKGKKLHQLTLFEKIEVCKYGLENYHKPIFDTHLDDLNKLNILRAWRNLFAHQRMDFKSDDTVTFMELLPNFKVSQSDYNIQKLWKDLLEYRESIFNILNGLKDIIIPPASLSPKP